MSGEKQLLLAQSGMELDQKFVSSQLESVPLISRNVLLSIATV
jgi:hypothetical protein